jgi:hypothetical protein
MTEIFIITKDGEPVLPKKGKKMPKAYLNPHNAHIAIMNMGGYSEGYKIEVYQSQGYVTQVGDRKISD